MVEVISDKCTGCGACLKVCPFGAIEMQDGTAIIDADKCTICGACVSACPFDAIMIRRFTNEKQDISQYKGVWVFAEQRENVIAPVVFELLGKGRELADKLEEELTAVLLGSNVQNLAEELIFHGADKVIIVDNDDLKDYLDIPYTIAFAQLAEKYKPEIILSGATNMGRSFIPRVAIELHTGLTADCTYLDIDEENNGLLQTRPAFGGNIMATIVTPYHRPQMATVRHKVMTPLPKDTTRSGIVIEEQVDLPADVLSSEFIKTVPEEEQTINITDANLIVAVGRGIKDQKNIEMIKDLAGILDAGIGGSRAVIDAEWLSYPHQVGQTGKTVKPTIYIAIGISGAIQHLAGMQSSDYIIAINKDPDAPIFKVADLGLVGDLFEVVPLLIKKLKELH